MSAHKLRWVSSKRSVFEDSFLLFLVVHICITDETFLKRMSSADEIISALDVRELFTYSADSTTDAVWNDFLINFEYSWVVVAGVTAE